MLYPNCNVRFPALIGNGFCDGQYYNKKKCGFDGGDCNGKSIVLYTTNSIFHINTHHFTFCNNPLKVFNKKYPRCRVRFSYFVGDGFCDDDGEGYFSKNCKYDGGDCDSIKEKYPRCEGPHSWLGDCECDENLNYEECGYDGGDCKSTQSLCKPRQWRKSRFKAQYKERKRKFIMISEMK